MTPEEQKQMWVLRLSIVAAAGWFIAVVGLYWIFVTHHGWLRVV